MNRRVVVTGLGAITPIGNNVPEFWSAVKQQKVGIGEITHFDATDYKCHLAAEVKDFDAKEYMDFRSAKRMEAFCQFAVAAAVLPIFWMLKKVDPIRNYVVPIISVLVIVAGSFWLVGRVWP